MVLPRHLVGRNLVEYAKCIRNCITMASTEKPVAKIAPSMLSSDFARLAEEAQRMLDNGADYLHMDVMDGHFVPNITIGAPVIKALRKHTNAYLDCHLMVSHPEQWVKDFADAGASGFTFHIEATGTETASKLIDTIHEHGMNAAVAVKPNTPVEDVFPIVDKVDMILIMTVEPGFGGQSFMADMMPKVQTLRQKYPNLDIEVDGGLGTDNIETAAKAGANVIVAGTSIFKSSDTRGTIKALRDPVEAHVTGK